MTVVIRILTFALPGVIVIATLEGLVLAFVMRRNYNWRAYFASLADALGRQYVVLTFFTLSLAAPAYMIGLTVTVSSRSRSIPPWRWSCF